MQLYSAIVPATAGSAVAAALRAEPFASGSHRPGLVL